MIRKSDIESKVTNEQIFRKYIKHPFKFGVPFLSELISDHNPSANIFKGVDGTPLYKDFRESDTLNCYGYVMKVYNTDFRGALTIIAHDFGIEENDISSFKKAEQEVKVPVIFEERERSKYEYEIKPWEHHEEVFWQRYQIKREVLDEYNVFPLLWIQTFKGERAFDPIESGKNYPIFLIQIGEGIKLYFPYDSDPRHKWLSNTKVTDIFGLEQAIKATENGKLPELGLVAGQKDVMSLYSNTGKRGIALSSEGAKFRFPTYLQMSQLAKWLFILYDNDKTGIKQTYKISKEFPMIPIYLNRFLGYSTLKGSAGINDTSDWYKYMKDNSLNRDRINNLIEYEKEQSNH